MPVDASSQTSSLFEPFALGPLTLPNRTVMAPLTRCRAAGPGRVPTELMATYYAQRASAGMIVTEATQVSPQGIGYMGTPGIHSSEQVEAWRRVTGAVHKAGGRIFLQLWHVGRISHSLFLNGERPVSSSAVPAPGEVYTPEGLKPYETPRALGLEEIPGIVAAFRRGAENAKAAGFDGVEVHGANGYLLDQFLRDGVNKRTDAYGGSVENRVRLLKEVTQAAVEVWGQQRVGVRLSPSGTFNGISDSDPEKTFSHVVRTLDGLGIAYIHIVEGNADDVRHGGRIVSSSLFRPLFKGAVVLCGDFTRVRAEEALAQGRADLVAFGKTFLANPDLPRRLKENKPLNAPDTATFYGGDAKGYTDYPFLDN